jgi:cholesterol oxidase
MSTQDAAREWDVAVVGSGFGGAVSALRLAERGHRVVVLERGRRLSDADLLAARRDLRRYLWAPALGMRGFFWQRVLRDVGVIGATAVGGGSIVWAGVLLEPPAAVYDDPAWAGLADWRAELAEPLEVAARMLGRTPSPFHGPMDDHLRAAAEAMGAGDTFGPVPLAIHFGREGVREPDPFFGGEGPERTGCRLCGECLLGCPNGAKNQLDRNYLWLAERRGAEIRPEHDVRALRPLPGGGYELAVAGREPVRARRVIVAAGVLGTVELLLRCRDELGTLPRLSPQLGRRVRTNSEAIVAVLAPPGEDLGRGPTISSEFYPDPHTHVTQNRYVGGRHMRLQLGPLVDGDRPGRRALATAAAIAAAPLRQARVVLARRFERRLIALTVMQHADNELTLRLGRSPVRPWRRVLRSRAPAGRRAPSFLPVASATARAVARAGGGRPLNLLAESLGGRSVTAHILGGAAIGADPGTGVVDASHEVFGHPGLYVADASAIPTNLGVNPSLTITALAERFAARFPAPGEPAASAELPPPPALGARSSQRAVRRAWPALRPPAAEQLDGDHEALFPGPPGFPALARRGLGLIGLPRWYGKRFSGGGAGAVNLVATGPGGTLEEVLPMTVRRAPSLLDGLDALVLAYPPDARLPWRHVRDELRVAGPGLLAGMTVVDLPGLRGTGAPFLLRVQR